MSVVNAPPAEPVIHDFIRLSSVCEALYLTCKKGRLIFEPRIWSYTVEVPAGIKTPSIIALSKSANAFLIVLSLLIWASDNLTAAHLAANSVGSSELADDAVDTDAIQDIYNDI